MKKGFLGSPLIISIPLLIDILEEQRFRVLSVAERPVQLFRLQIILIAGEHNDLNAVLVGDAVNLTEQSPCNALLPVVLVHADIPQSRNGICPVEEVVAENHRRIGDNFPVVLADDEVVILIVLAEPIRLADILKGDELSKTSCAELKRIAQIFLTEVLKSNINAHISQPPCVSQYPQGRSYRTGS